MAVQAIWTGVECRQLRSDHLFDFTAEVAIDKKHSRSQGNHLLEQRRMSREALQNTGHTLAPKVLAIAFVGFSHNPCRLFFFDDSNHGGNLREVLILFGTNCFLTQSQIEPLIKTLSV